MEKVFGKVSNYNLMNNLLIGIIFLIFNKYYFYIDIESLNLIFMFIIAYFIGMTLNRLGSFVGGTILKIKKENGECYSTYILAEQKDEKVQILLQERNIYRSILTTTIICLLEIITYPIIIYLNISKKVIIILIMILIICIYMKAFIKQNNYLCKRIRTNNDIFKKNNASSLNQKEGKKRNVS